MRRTAILGVVLVLAGASAAQDGVSTWVAERLREAARDGAAIPADLSVSYLDGSGFHGFTEVAVAGTGATVVRHSEPGDQNARSYEATLPEARVRALVRLLVERQIWTVRNRRAYGVPDETRPTVTVACGGERFEVWLWANDVDADPAFGPVRRAFLDIAREVSDGQVTY